MEQTMASKLQKTNKSMVQTWLITWRFQQMELNKNPVSNYMYWTRR